MRRNRARDRIISASLALATCIGLSSVFAYRMIEEGSKAVVAANTSSLDSYAAQLDAERLRLDKYRSDLAAIANQLIQINKGQTPVAIIKKSAIKLKSVPKSKPAPPVVSKPQSTTKSS